MNPYAILHPVFAMFLLVILVLLRLTYLRLSAVDRREISAAHFRHYRQDGTETDEMVFTSRNFINIFEMPVLFFTVCILIYVTGKVELYYVVLAWIYVLGRYVHSYIHATSNVVLRRFYVYTATNLVLLAMWVKLAVDIIFVRGAAA